MIFCHLFKHMSHSLTKMIMIMIFKQSSLSEFKIREAQASTRNMPVHGRGSAFKTSYASLKCESRGEHVRKDYLREKGHLLEKTSGEECMLNRYAPFSSRVLDLSSAGTVLMMNLTFICSDSASLTDEIGGHCIQSLSTSNSEKVTISGPPPVLLSNTTHFNLSDPNILH